MTGVPIKVDCVYVYSHAHCQFQQGVSEREMYSLIKCVFGIFYHCCFLCAVFEQTDLESRHHSGPRFGHSGHPDSKCEGSLQMLWGVRPLSPVCTQLLYFLVHFPLHDHVPWSIHTNVMPNKRLTVVSFTFAAKILNFNLVKYNWILSRKGKR